MKRMKKGGRLLSHPCTRRDVLIAAGAGIVGGTLSRLVVPWKDCAAPAQIKGRTLRIVQWSHFVPAFDMFFDRFASDWGRANGLTVRVDHQPIGQLPTVVASEAALGSGHDIFQMAGHIQTRLYYRNVVDLTDLCDRIGRRFGGWLPSARSIGLVNGRWYAYPDFYVAQPMLYRKDLFATFVIPDMMGHYIRSGDLEGAISWGMRQIKDIYAKYKR